MKHTPGPWVVGNNTGLPGFEGVLDSKGNRILTPVPMYATDINDEERETRRANNFLISKSPELLEKLKKLLPKPRTWNLKSIVNFVVSIGKKLERLNC